MASRTSIGTAWIQIKPSTTGLGKTIGSELNDEAGNAGETAGSKFSSGFAVKAGLVAGLAQTAFSKVASVVSSSFDAAIERTDTINNFANVMSNLNVSNEDAEASIDKLSDRLTGLPTSLDDAASAVQRFTTANSDVTKSTDIFLALNDALIAGGAGAETQATALEQISQAYAKGKPDMVEWRSLLTAMPAQAKQLSEALNFESVDALGEALRSGDLSMDDFMAKIVELDNAGTNGFKSFNEQAVAATDTLQTRITNVQTSLVKLVAAALNGDDLEKPIMQLVDRVGELIPKLLPAFVKALLGLVQAIPQLLPPLLTTITEMIPDILEGIKNVFISISEMLPEIFPMLLDAVMALILGLIDVFVDPEFLGMMFRASMDFLLQIVLAIPDVLIALIDALPDLIAGLIGFLTDPENLMKIIDAAVKLFFGIVEAVPRITSSLLMAFADLTAKLWETLKNNFGKFAANFGDFLRGIFVTAINGVLAYIENVINTPIKLINKFVDIINSTLGAIGVNLKPISLISLPRLATGGLVTGVGTSTSDSNLYALSKGEYVINAASAQKIGYDNLERMNRTGDVSGGFEQTINFTINGYDRDPNELADIISRKIAFKTQGVLA